jgi:ribonuclease HI
MGAFKPTDSIRRGNQLNHPKNKIQPSTGYPPKRNGAPLPATRVPAEGGNGSQSHRSQASRKSARKVIVYTDGAIRPERRASGLAAIVRDEQGKICYWWQQRAGSLTCNEAEYAAAIFALERLLQIKNQEHIGEVEVFCDSRVVVDQMQGRAQAHAPGLRQAQSRLRALTERFEKVTFHHISRERNRLADALAFEAVEGWDQQKPEPSVEEPHEEIIKEFFSSWRSS